MTDCDVIDARLVGSASRPVISLAATSRPSRESKARNTTEEAPRPISS